ncbi:hypothetical protein [Streptomyces albireticuli]|nr:hypothetical protein [Streptomyces albireticuli]MCD9141139.1 hypothetical protein [Streptomyces albireticuli]MCD9160900.1 hypothetical protein [Streptomyces albireticuli]MCD9191043.1 hypothetical protein [Streptomyces albireticuli]
MRTATWLTTAVTAAACGSLALGAASSAPAEARTAAHGTRAAAQRNEVPGALDEIRTLVSRITREARSASPDTATLRSLRRQLDRPAGRLLDDATARPKAAPMAPDPLPEVKQLLDELNKDVTRIIDDVTKTGTAASTEVDGVVADLKEILARIPALVAGAVPTTSGTLPG